MNSENSPLSDIDRAAMLDRVAIILIGTSDPGNIGSAARAMKTMGLSDLRLVDPVHAPETKAHARASGADDLLQAATTHDTLADALTGCVTAVGASARLRSLPWPVQSPRESAAAAVQTLLQHHNQEKVAFVFGREKTGLTNAELEACHALVNIPANPEYSSLNLAASVQVLAYEIRQAVMGEVHNVVEREAPLAPGDEMERFHAHLEQVMTEIGFLKPDNPKQLMRRLRRLFHRAEVDQNEVNILRGILTSVQWRIANPDK